MKVEITENAKAKILEYNQKEIPVRLVVQGISWCGPTFAVVSEKHLVDDKIYKSDGIEIAISVNVSNILEKATIDYSNKFFRKGFIVMPVPKKTSY